MGPSFCPQELLAQRLASEKYFAASAFNLKTSSPQAWIK